MFVPFSLPYAIEASNFSLTLHQHRTPSEKLEQMAQQYCVVDSEFRRLLEALEVGEESKHKLQNFIISNMGWKQSVEERIAISQAWTEFEQEELVMSGLPQQQLSKPHAESLVVFALNCDTMPRIPPSGFRVGDSSTREGSSYCPA